MPIKDLPPEVLNRIAAQLVCPREVLAFEETCRFMRNAVQDVGPSSAWSQVFHAELHTLHQKRVTLELVPPESYRDAFRGLPLKRRLNEELGGIQRDPLFKQLDPHQGLIRRLRQARPAGQAYFDQLDRIWSHIPAPPHHSVLAAFGSFVEAEVRRESYDALGIDPKSTLTFLKCKRSMAQSQGAHVGAKEAGAVAAFGLSTLLGAFWGVFSRG